MDGRRPMVVYIYPLMKRMIRYQDDASFALFSKRGVLTIQMISRRWAVAMIQPNIEYVHG
jgi:hypothetical protein